MAAAPASAEKALRELRNRAAGTAQPASLYSGLGFAEIEVDGKPPNTA
jgi:hypothetical protein